MTFSILGTDTQTQQRVELPQASRREGLYVIGATGTGKSTLLENLILQDINQGLGICVLDPHGDLVNAVISRMKKRVEDIILIDLGSEAYVTGLHLFHCEHPDDAFEAENVVQAVMHILEKVYHISRDTPLMNQYFINIARTLIYNPQATVLDIPRLLTDAAFRASLLANVPDDDVHWFWSALYEQQRRGRRSDEILSMVTDKLVEFNSPVLKPWFGQNGQTLNTRRIMDDRKILLVKLKARWQSMTSLIGSIFIAQILDAAYSREDTRVNKRKQFNVYADEFQTFASQDFAQLFTEARKYGIGITISHQVFEQLDETIKATIKQAANIVVFRVSADNAKEIAGEFDCTPPEGQPIYEKQMRKAERTYEVEYWEPQEAEEEYNALAQQLPQVELDQIIMKTTFSWLKSTNDIDLPPDYKAIDWYGNYTYTIDREAVMKDTWNLSLATYKAVAERNELVSIQKIANALAMWFRPDSEDPQVYAYLRSFYEQEDTPIKFMGERKGYRVRLYDLKGEPYKGEWAENFINSELEFHPSSINPYYHLSTGWGDVDHWVRYPKPIYYSRLRLKAGVQVGKPYTFPVSLPSYFERYPVGGMTIRDYPYWIKDEAKLAYADRHRASLLSELREVWQQFTPYAHYYFDYDQYEKDYNDIGASRPLCIAIATNPHKVMGYTLLGHWKGPFFADLEPWRQILLWLYNQIAPVINRKQAIIAKRERLWNECHKVETRFAWAGWYEPTPVTEWEELAKIKAFARDSNQEFLVGDNVKYMMRPGPPLYGTDEAEKRIANQIKLLPKFTARVRLATGEYTLTTEKPSGYSNEQELLKRIQSIHDRNTKDGYIRLRSDVEAELMQRRQPVLASPRVTQQQSPRRIARQVPVKGNCSKCGASNSPSSKFCNQCGQPL